MRLVPALYSMPCWPINRTARRGVQQAYSTKTLLEWVSLALPNWPSCVIEALSLRSLKHLLPVVHVVLSHPKQPFAVCWTLGTRYVIAAMDRRGAHGTQ